MTADEYDDFLANPDGFTFRVLWPRIAKKLEPLASFPPLYYYFNYPDSLGQYFSDPAVVNALKAFQALGEAWEIHNRIKTNCYRELEDLGYPRVYDGIIFPPFDTLSVWLRGGKGTFTDIFRNPSKLLAVVDLFTEMQIESGVAQAQYSGNPRVTIFAYRGAGGFMSDQHFEKFYWPSLRRLITELLDKDVRPQLYFQGDANPRLPYLAELPKGKVPIHFDWVDRKDARKYMAGNNCFWGNVPVSIMEYGTIQQVEDDVKELIDLFAPGGGLIIDSSGAITDNAKPENVEAMVRAVHIYGKK
jgi:uroporphyrinogen-III decarboxylase